MIAIVHVRRSLVRLFVRDRPELDVFFEREVVGAADFQEGPLAALDLDARFRQSRGDLMGDQAHSVLVGVDQVADCEFRLPRSRPASRNRPAARRHG